MRNEQHYRHMLEKNSNASVGFSLAAAMVYAARYGSCEPADHGTDEWAEIARRLKNTYGENLTVSECSNEMDKARKSAAASLLRGDNPSEAQSNASRENGKLGGRPSKKEK